MTQGDAYRLRNLIERHARYTGSERARHILDNWTECLPRFVKVMPVDYRKALEKMKKTQAQVEMRH
jgi:glutamate synthase (NADPH/NADH) large chain